VHGWIPTRCSLLLLPWCSYYFAMVVAVDAAVRPVASPASYDAEATTVDCQIPSSSARPYQLRVADHLHYSVTPLPSSMDSTDSDFERDACVESVRNDCRDVLPEINWICVMDGAEKQRRHDAVADYYFGSVVEALFAAAWMPLGVGTDAAG